MENTTPVKKQKTLLTFVEKLKIMQECGTKGFVLERMEAIYEAELSKLRELIPYAQHMDECEYLNVAVVNNELRSTNNPCTCGLADLLNTIKG